MLAKVCSAAVNGIEAYPVEVEVNVGYGDIRLAEDAAETAEKMAEQNAILVNESRALTKYTRGLYWLTAALVGFAIVQIMIMVIDYYKHS